MSEELFERYLRNDLDEAGARELSAILETDEGSRAFSDFVQEWTLLGEGARQRVEEADRKRMRRRAAAPPRGRAWIGWAAGLAAAAIFAIAILNPTRHPPPAQPSRVVTAPPARDAEPPPPAPVPDPELPPPAPRPEPPEPPPAPPLPPPVVEPKPETAPEPPPRPAEATKVVRPVIAVVGPVQGDVQVVSADGRRKAAAGERISPDEGLETTGSASLATLEFPDGTRIELGPETAVERLVERAGRRTVALSRGSASVVVVKQAVGRVMALTTPHAEITVIGTQFSLVVTGEATRLEVREGRVRMTRIPDGASAEVAAGNGAIAARGQKLESKPVVHTRDFQDGAGYVGTGDTSVSGAEPARTFGSEEDLEVRGDDGEGRKVHALLKWDLTDLPPVAVIRSAVITLNVLRESQGRGTSVYELKRAWSEADATWSLAAPRQAWRVAGLKSPVDRGVEPLGALAPRMRGTLTILLSPAAEAVIQGWLRNPGSNHGFLIATDAVADGFRFSSREAFPHGLRPKLTLTYTLPGK